MITIVAIFLMQESIRFFDWFDGSISQVLRKLDCEICLSQVQLTSTFSRNNFMQLLSAQF